VIKVPTNDYTNKTSVLQAEHRQRRGSKETTDEDSDLAGELVESLASDVETVRYSSIIETKRHSKILLLASCSACASSQTKS